MCLTAPPPQQMHLRFTALLTLTEYSAAALIAMVAPAMRVKATSKAVAGPPPTAVDSSSSGTRKATAPNAKEVTDNKPYAAACCSLPKVNAGELLVVVCSAVGMAGVGTSGGLSVFVWSCAAAHL
jgi:hypothetical protein